MARSAFFSRFLASTAILGIGGDADAHGDVQFMPVDAIGRAQLPQDFLRANGRVLRIRHLREQDHEFVAPMAADRIGVAHALQQPLRYGLQEAVADVVAQRVVDVLETIDVEKQHGHLVPVAVRERHGVCELFVHQHPVGQIRQGVMLRLIRQTQ